MNQPQRILDRQEVRIHENILDMARLAREAGERAMDSLLTQNAELAQDVVAGDTNINALLRLTENACLEALALQQPVAADLRDIVASMQIAGELERIADHAKDIAVIVLGMDPGDFSGPMEPLERMHAICIDMLGRMMEAYQNRDAALARAVALEDNEVDELDEKATSRLLMQLMSNADPTMHSTHLLWIAYHLERIGDRITNIGERVVFMATAETPELG